ncbi:MAG: hypothetical protein PVH63_11355 [Balneolaceae bacterium]|jgi:hypothetical protein
MNAQDQRKVLKQELKSICQELQEKMTIINKHVTVQQGHSNTR